MKIKVGDIILLNNYEGEVYSSTYLKDYEFRVNLYDSALTNNIDIRLKQIKTNTFKILSGLPDQSNRICGLTYEKNITPKQIKLLFRPGSPTNKLPILTEGIKISLNKKRYTVSNIGKADGRITYFNLSGAHGKKDEHYNVTKEGYCSYNSQTYCTTGMPENFLLSEIKVNYSCKPEVKKKGKKRKTELDIKYEFLDYIVADNNLDPIDLNVLELPAIKLQWETWQAAYKLYRK